VAKRKKPEPPNRVFDRIRAIYHADCIQPPKPTRADLNVIEKTQRFKFPLAYREFAQRFGLNAYMGFLLHVLPLRHPDAGRTGQWWAEVEFATSYTRGFWVDEYRALNGGADPRLDVKRLVVFAMDELVVRFVFNTAEVTDASRREYRVYGLYRDGHIRALADSFAGWLEWIDRQYHPGEHILGRVVYPLVAKPHRDNANPIPYELTHGRKKKAPLKRDVKQWLAFNGNTARDLALAARDHGRADAFPALADALQEAGCTNADLLESCRGGDPDIDGVWVLRVLLGGK
jgi:hypothetical protein